jgi:hypothetical protein
MRTEPGGRNLAGSNIAWSVTKHAAQRSARLYHQPAATTTLSAHGYACGFATKHAAERSARLYHQPAAARQLKNQSPELPQAIPGADNCFGP